MRRIFMSCSLVRSLRFLACLIGFICCSLSFHPMASAEHMVRASQMALVGTWSLVSLYEEDVGGEELGRWGNSPQGRFIAGSEGEFTFLLIGKDLIFLATTDSELACHAIRACREGMERKVTGYAGTYSVDETKSSMVFKVKDALERNW